MAATCFTSIRIPTELRDALERVKVHPRQPFHEIIGGLVQVPMGHGHAVKGQRARKRA
ncbi:MAG TPA: hypothetical protein VM286_02825 [Candidatus Thermoplasmatota archaeon]|nr:hypothetical protein [Candidatus Thermoplasmatota archaeon]